MTADECGEEMEMETNSCSDYSAAGWVAMEVEVGTGIISVSLQFSILDFLCIRRLKTPWTSLLYICRHDKHMRHIHKIES